MTGTRTTNFNISLTSEQEEDRKLQMLDICVHVKCDKIKATGNSPSLINTLNPTVTTTNDTRSPVRTFLHRAEYLVSEERTETVRPIDWEGVIDQEPADAI